MNQHLVKRVACTTCLHGEKLFQALIDSKPELIATVCEKCQPFDPEDSLEHYLRPHYTDETTPALKLVKSGQPFYRATVHFSTTPLMNIPCIIEEESIEAITQRLNQLTTMPYEVKMEQIQPIIWR